MDEADPIDELDSSDISDARRLAATAVMLLENPRLKATLGDSGLYKTAADTANLILHLVQESELCTTAEEFDGVLYLLRCNADGLATTLSRLRIE